MNYYNANNNPYSYNQYQQYQQYQQPQPQPQQQQNFMNLLVVNGYQDVEKYIVLANQTVNFYDSKNGYIFVKSADGIGKYSIKAFKLNEIDLNAINNPSNIEYATRNDLNALENVFNEKMNNISSKIENLLKREENNE